MHHFEHLDALDIDLFQRQLRVVCWVASLGDRNLAPLLVGGYLGGGSAQQMHFYTVNGTHRDTGRPQSCELLVGTLRLEAALSLQQGRLCTWDQHGSRLLSDKSEIDSPHAGSIRRSPLLPLKQTMDRRSNVDWDSGGEWTR